MSRDRNLVNKIFLPFSIGLICIAIVSIYSIHYVKNQYMLHKISIQTNLVRNTWDQKIIDNEVSFSSMLDFIEKDKNIIKYFKERNRDYLYDSSKEFYASLAEKHNLTHFYFHEKDRKVF